MKAQWHRLWQYLKDHSIWSKVVASVVFAALLTIWTWSTHFDWLATSAVPRWLLGVLILGDLAFLALVTDLVRKRRKALRPRWFTWNEFDWQLLGAFFENRHLEPDRTGDIGIYIRGPFCRNAECRREVPILEFGEPPAWGPTSFAHSVAKCSCNPKVFMIQFGREVIGIPETRAVLVAACREAQAAFRRGELFRLSQ
jgi:hypothetical protein